MRKKTIIKEWKKEVESLLSEIEKLEKELGYSEMQVEYLLTKIREMYIHLNKENDE